jgi:HEPN domain-containing protein
MKEENSDRALLVVAKANVKSAWRDLEEPDEVFVNFAMFNTSQAIEKALKFLCSCYDIDYDYSHFFGKLMEKLLEKNVAIPELIQDNAENYGAWATKARYRADQMAQRSYVKKHIDCADEWIKKIEKDFGLNQFDASASHHTAEL